MRNNTTFQTKDQATDLSRQQQGLNPNDVLLAENQKGNKKSKREELWVSPIENLPNFSFHSIETATKISELGRFEEIKALLQELVDKKNIICLPQNGMHDDTPFNMHLTNSSSLGSHVWLPPVNQERQANVYYKKSHFLSQYNMNSSNLDAAMDLGQPQSHFKVEAGTFVGGYYSFAEVPAATLSDSIFNMNVFEA